MFDKIITGIGAREVREEMSDLGWDLGRYISDRNILFRTGDAKSGMDLAFLEGWVAGSKVGDCIVYGHYKSYSAKTVYSNLKSTDIEAYTKKVTSFKRLQTRNYFQVMGEIHSRKVPSDLVLFCARKLGGIYIGGTATTVSIAKEAGTIIMDLSECDRELIIATIEKINFKMEDDIIPF